MDIQGWLQGTADRAPPYPSDESNALHLIQAAHSVEAAKAPRYHRKRQRAATDSSIIAPQQKTGLRSKVRGELAGVGRGRHVHKSPSRYESASRGGSIRPASQEHSRDARMEQSDSKTYERRARHKTRPDRYEPKTTKKGKRERPGNVDERKPKHKSGRVHRGGDGKRTESLVQGFRLKNGPANSRLTLKPDVGAGMFKHGRTSAQTAGRSNGLPDLAFNELKFLRQSNEHQDEQYMAQSNMRKSSNQDKKREAQRQEISAYFEQRNRRHVITPEKRTARRPTLAVDGDMLADYVDMGKGGSSPRLSDGELPAIPYLGFGSKGAISKGSKPRPSSTTSYLTWSESGDGLATSRKRKPAFETALEASELTVTRPKQVRRSQRDSQKVSANDASKGRTKGRSNVSKRHEAKTTRIRVPADIDVYTDLGIFESNPSIEMRSKSQSLPEMRPNESSRDQRKHPHAVNHAGTLSSDDKSFRTSDILKLRNRLHRLAEPLPSGPESTYAPPHDKENVPPTSSSSPTAKILRIAHEAMLQHQLEMPAHSPPRLQQETVFETVRRQHPSYPSTEFRHQFERDLRVQDVDNFHQPVTMNSASLMGNYVELQAMHDAHGEEVESENAEIMDEYIVDEPQYRSAEADIGNLRYTHVYSKPGIRSNMRSWSRQDHMPPTRERDMPWSRSDLATTRRDTSSHNTLTRQDMSIREVRVADHEFEDGLEGFWRPNRLY